MAERPRPTKFYRWVVLFFVSLTMFGNYYIYDAINPVTDLMKAQLSLSDQEIGRLNSIYSVAAVIVLLIGGVIIDKLGTKISVFIFSVLCLVAAVLTVITPIPTVVFAGRFVLGLGAEPLIVAVTTALAKWFKGKELSFAFGLNLTIARLGSVAADNSPTWAKHIVDFSNWRSPLTLGIAFGAICVVAAVFYWMLEGYAERNYTLGRAAQTEKLVWTDLFRFGVSYWFIVGLCMTFYSAIFPFRTFAVKFFIEGHGTSRELGGFLNSVIPQAAIYATPLFGLMVDKVGRRALLMIFGSLLLIPAFLLMLPGLHVSLYPSIIFLGIAFSLVPAVMWPSVAYIVEEQRLGTAYALMTLIQQIGFFALNEIIGRLNDTFGAGTQNPAGYAPMIYLLSTLGVLGVMFAVLLRKRETGPYGHGLETITAKST
ncbi:MAG: MFS transporter [Terriglobales bacterium]